MSDDNKPRFRTLPTMDAPVMGDIFEALEKEGTSGLLRAKEDVWREVYVRGTDRPTHVLVIGRGATVPEQQVASMLVHQPI